MIDVALPPNMSSPCVEVSVCGDSSRTSTLGERLIGLADD